MDAINNLLAGDFTSLTSLAILIAVLLVAILVLYWLFGLIFRRSSSRLAKNRQPRLSLTDAAVVDDKRRLVLVRRDDVEHLLMIGGPSDIVVERNIMRAAPVGVPNARYQQAAGAQSTPVDHRQSQAAVTSQAEQRLEPAHGESRAPSPAVPAAAATATAGAAGFAASNGQNGSAATPSPVSSITGITKDMSTGVPDTNTATANAASQTESQISEVLSSISVAPDNDMTSSPVDAGTEKHASTDTPSDDLIRSLEDELGSERSPSAGNAPEVSSHASSSKTEDEMQRLLDQLTSEKR